MTKSAFESNDVFCKFKITTRPWFFHVVTGTLLPGLTVKLDPATRHRSASPAWLKAFVSSASGSPSLKLIIVSVKSPFHDGSSQILPVLCSRGAAAVRVEKSRRYSLCHLFALLQVCVPVELCDFVPKKSALQMDPVYILRDDVFEIPAFLQSDERHMSRRRDRSAS